MRKLIAAGVFGAALCLSACDDLRVPQSSERATTNSAYQVDLLFIHDGVKVYRFRDEGRNHYFVVTNSGAPAESKTEYDCGKNCTYEERIQTVAAK